MTKKYHYVWFWQAIDLCYGGAKSGDFGQKALALMFKPQKGLWQLKRKRVYDTED